ncbi:hypothetical protein BC830DRAFT_169094 [Chytriomyces sp. MP71]|nr:hypothetical protein BC830DRAFT_169094 [Chytriomyces sp. MP71]
MSRPVGPATSNAGAATRLRAPSKVAASLPSAEPLSFPVVSVKANRGAATTTGATRRPPSTTMAASAASSKPARKPSNVSVASAPVARKEVIIDNHSAKRKRPAWDVKGRLEDMEEYSKATTSKLSDSKNLIQGLTSKLNDGQEQINELLQFKLHLESQFHSKQMENTEMNGQLKHLETELEVKATTEQQIPPTFTPNLKHNRMRSKSIH